MPLTEDTVLENRYRIDGLLAHGGMGSVYKGFDTNLQIPVAIKENFFQTPHSIQQFQQEALILARLHHPALPRVTHHFSFEGQQYLVMDFIEGQNLWEIVKRQRRPLEEGLAINYIIQICQAVSYLHRQSPPIIHRDIKPQNIKITPAGEAVLVDFGISKQAEGDSRTSTGAQGVTPGFSPPEQYSGAGTTPLSDIYSLGATLYAVLTGKKPPDSISLLVNQANFESPDVVNPKLGPQICQAIIRAMQPQSANRPQSVAAWQKELDAILEAPTLSQPDQPPTTPAGQDAEETMAGVSAPAEAATGAYWLVDSAGQAYAIGLEPLVIGRHSQAGVIINDKSASRYHALIRIEGQRCLVQDNNSSNGTFINTQQLSSGWHPLMPNDVLTIGSMRFHLEVRQAGQITPPLQPPLPVVEEDAGTRPCFTRSTWDQDSSPYSSDAADYARRSVSKHRQVDFGSRGSGACNHNSHWRNCLFRYKFC